MNAEQTIFIVDDDPSVRLSLCALARSQGVKAIAFASAQEFLDCPERGSASCVVTDVRLPGMDGYQLCERLRHEGSDVPLIVITGFAESPEGSQVAPRADIRVLEKTCSTEELWGAIEEALRERPWPGGPQSRRASQAPTTPR